MEVTDGEQKKKDKRIKRKQDSLRDLWDNIKHTNICIISVPEGEEREKGAENIFEDLIAKNFPNLRKQTAIQVQPSQRVPYRIQPKRNTPRHIVIKMEKIIDKERILKAAREKQQITHKETPIRSPLAFQEKLYRPEGSGTIYLKQ